MPLLGVILKVVTSTGPTLDKLLDCFRLTPINPIRNSELGANVYTKEHFPFSYAGSTALRDASNSEKPRGLKPAARNTETGNALAAL